MSCGSKNPKMVPLILMLQSPPGKCVLMNADHSFYVRTGYRQPTKKADWFTSQKPKEKLNNSVL